MGAEVQGMTDMHDGIVWEYVTTRAMDAAIERVEEARLEAEAWHVRSKTGEPCDRLRWDAALHRQTERTDQAAKIFADDLLPRIAAGQWRRARRGLLDFRRGATLNWQGTVPLRSSLIWPATPNLDHTYWFRRVGSKGQQSWANSILTTHPYHTGEFRPDPAFAYIQIPSWWFPGATKGWAIIRRDLLAGG